MGNWTIGKTYRFTPSGDADELLIKVVAQVPSDEAIKWFEQTYNRSIEDQPFQEAPYFKAVIVRGGYDADIKHRRGDTYYVSTQEFEPGHRVQLVK